MSPTVDQHGRNSWHEEFYIWHKFVDGQVSGQLVDCALHFINCIRAEEYAMNSLALTFKHLGHCLPEQKSINLPSPSGIFNEHPIHKPQIFNPQQKTVSPNNNALIFPQRSM